MCPTRPSFRTPKTNTNTTQSPGVEWRELARPGLHLWYRDPDLWRFETEEEARLAAAPQRRRRIELCVTNWVFPVKTRCQDLHPIQHILWKLKCILLCCFPLKTFPWYSKEKRENKKNTKKSLKATVPKWIFCVKHFYKDNLWLILSKFFSNFFLIHILCAEHRVV